MNVAFGTKGVFVRVGRRVGAGGMGVLVLVAGREVAVSEGCKEGGAVPHPAALNRRAPEITKADN